MINIDGIRQLLKDCKVYIKETDKNFLIKCPYCGDHRLKSKWGHNYVSKNEAIPTYHCWLCNESGPITKLLFDLTGSKSKELIDIQNFDNIRKTKQVVKKVSKVKHFELPELDIEKYPHKTNYMRTRTFGKLDVSKIPNLIFDFEQFLNINSIDAATDLKLSKWELDLLQHNFVIFLSKHHTLLYARNVSKETKIPFRKIPVQKSDTDMLDYYEVDLGHPDNNTIILAEGNFDILGCYAHNSLKLNGRADCYAAGCSFSYSALLKSVCYDRSLYNANVYILSDNDKKEYHYRNFIRNAYTAKDIKIVYNRYGKDFGVKEQAVTKVF